MPDIRPTAPPSATNPPPLPPAAQRALAEAAARREHQAAQVPKEFQGRGGPDPVRYGDWEVKGVATDF
jgi:hypothetical protein